MYNDIIGNEITGMYYYGIYWYYMGSYEISRNYIHGFTNASGYCIMAYYSIEAIIDGNILNPGQYGIYTYYMNYYDHSKHSYIQNNMISNFQNTSYQNGIRVYYYNYNNHIINNTIWVDGSYANNYNYAAIYVYYYPYYCEIKNNILISTYNTMLLSFYYGYNLNSCDYNDYYYTGSSAYYFYNMANMNWTTFKNSTTYIGSHDQHSYHQEIPGVISQSNLHLMGGNEGLTGDALGLQTDVDGDPRCQLVSFLGADEPFWAPSISDFIAKDTMCLFTPVTFYNTGNENDPHISSWYLNGVFETSDFNYTHSFTEIGKDTITLLMQTCSGTDTITKVITIDSPATVPSTEFMSNKNIVEVDELVNLYDLTLNCPTEWEWSISPDTAINPNTGLPELTYEWLNATDKNSRSPEMKFKFSGAYSVCLTTKNMRGTGTQNCKTDYINVKFSDNMCGTYIETDQLY